MTHQAPLAELPDEGPERYVAGDLIAKKYELLRRLGRGGMGEVWLARNRALDAQVALKLISPAVEADETQQKALAQRLLEEARATAQLHHPAIVRVFDFGLTRKGDPMIVMEFLEGQNLHAAVEEVGCPSPLRAVRLLLPVIHGLDAVHEKGVVHRDIKPENIFLCQTAGGQVQPKLVDFGIARRAARRDTRLTMAGSVMGSPEYMSPEQAKGEDASTSSDVWGISVVLYELLMGRTPFASNDLATQLYRIIHEPPPPVHGVEGAAQLWPIIQKGLAKEAGDRWASMRELGTALAEFALAHGAREDISGASLEATWFRAPVNASSALLSIPPPPDSGLARRATPVSGVARRVGDAPAAASSAAAGAPEDSIDDLMLRPEFAGMRREVRRRRLRVALWILVMAALAIAGTLLAGAG
jgi:eukaryotic-like serine/threonine-protein kinase